MYTPNTQFNLSTNGEIRLGGLLLLKVVSVNQPFLKASLQFQDLSGDGTFLFDANSDDWLDISAMNPIVVGLGDRLILGDVQVLITNFSKNQGIVRLSLRSENLTTSQLIREHKPHD